MNFYIINGSPRKNCNTSQLLNKTIKGLEKSNPNANINLIHLYDLNYKGCKSCFHCKKIDGKYYSQCPIKDDLKEILPEIWESDGIILGSPIYFGSLTGEMRSFIERLLFPKFVYGAESLIDKKIPVGIIYTMNIKKELCDHLYENTIIKPFEEYLKRAFKGDLYSYKACDTYQFKDYSKYENYLFKEEDKREVREKQFPKDLDEAYNIGLKLKGGR